LSIAKPIAKCLAVTITAGAVTFKVMTAMKVSAALCIPATALASFSALLCFARVWIQGYYFDKRCTINVDLTGRVALVTGGTIGGLGFEAAKILCQMGATVVLTVRSPAKGNAAVAELQRACGHSRISYHCIDFKSASSIQSGAQAIIAAHDRLDMLVLNAGVGTGPSDELWMSNQVGPFMFTEALRPLLISTARAHGDVRVCAVSSGAHKRAQISFADPWHPASGGSYGQSKVAQIMHMREMQGQIRQESGLDGEQSFRAISVTPGMAFTNIFASSIPKPAIPLVWFLSRSAHVGAHVIKMALVDKDVLGGSYLSNCYVKPAEGVANCANDPKQWKLLWELCQRNAEEAKTRFP